MCRGRERGSRREKGRIYRGRSRRRVYRKEVGYGENRREKEWRLFREK